MAKSVTADLELWADVDKDLPTKDRGLLLGNGASITMWPRFGYSSLYDIASAIDQGGHHLTAREVAIFEMLETKNFEEILSAITVSGRVWKAHDKPSAAIRMIFRMITPPRSTMARERGAVNLLIGSPRRCARSSRRLRMRVRAVRARH